jgi:hypothetical protein
VNSLSMEWKRLAGLYQLAVDAVRDADYDARVSAADYAALVDKRELAFAALSAQSARERLERKVSL